MKSFGLFRCLGAASMGALILAGAPALSAQTAAELNTSGQAKLAEGNLAGAASDFTAAIALSPADASLYANRATAETGQTNYVGAVADYTQVIKLKPDQANGYLLRGLANLIEGNLAGAGQDCSKAIELQPKDPTLYLYRGLVEDCDNDQQGAVADFTKAIALGGASGSLTANYAQLYRALDLRRQGAEVDVELGDYESWKNPWTKTVASYLSGKISDADLLNRAGASEPDERSQKRERAEAYYFTGRVHALNGDVEGAKAAYRASYDLQYPGDVQRRLAQLELERLNAAH